MAHHMVTYKIQYVHIVISIQTHKYVHITNNMSTHNFEGPTENLALDGGNYGKAAHIYVND